MTDFPKQYALWDEFLTAWPTSRLATMALDEYSQAGSKDSFTYWIESGLDELGSIWGGSSFKFGVFSRRDTEDKASDAKLSYSDSHGWYSSLGATAEESFEKVRRFVVQVADWAAAGDLNAIEAFEHLGEAFKWKIAFHYQNREAPTIAAIFKRAPLAIFVGETANKSMTMLQQAAMAKRPSELGVLEFSRQVWEAWSQKNLDIWKLSHGNPPNFTDAERQQYLEDQWAVMHRDTGKGQGKKFAEAPVGTLFFLCHGNSPQRIGQFTSNAMPCSKGDGWLKRSYRVLKTADRTDRYTANSKAWSPQGNSTFWRVGAHDLPEFESTLVTPFFGTDLAELAGLAGEPIENTTHNILSEQQAASPAAGITAMSTCFNRIYYGPPGTGKTYTLMQLLKRDYPQQNYCFVTFHQSYGYEEFVEGLRPVLVNKKSDTEKPANENNRGEVKYEIRPGAFKKLCEAARQAPDQRFAMVIDEINRGNISKIFGELITLIEPDKRDPLDGGAPPIELTLAYSGDQFSVSANVDIIGTMNTADRSLALLDTALRRRFDFVPLMPDTRATKEADNPHSAPLAGLVVTTNAGAIDMRRMLERINERIEALYDRDHSIGHAYLTGLTGVSDGEVRFDLLADIFRNRILPLLEEYFFEDWRKIRLVLGDNQKAEPAQFITESGAQEQDLSDPFGNNHDLDRYTTKRRYQLQSSAFANPAAY